jgi:hypothetical protein
VDGEKPLEGVLFCKMEWIAGEIPNPNPQIPSLKPSAEALRILSIRRDLLLTPYSFLFTVHGSPHILIYSKNNY